MTERIGVVVCECGPNIRDAMDVPGLVAYAAGRPGVVVAESHGLLCSESGGTFLGDLVREHELTRVVVAACSPKEHEATFRRAIERAGLNGYLLQVANIREQCAWVTEDRELALAKAKRLVGAAIERVACHDALEAREIDCRTDVLVVGAGVAGMSAALTLAQKGRRIFVVEKQPWVGGMTARYEDVFPGLECASCMLEPLIDEVLHNESIEVLTGSELVELLGSRGNYTARVVSHARGVDVASCIGCDECVHACPVSTPDVQVPGFGERAAIGVPFAGMLPNVPAIDRDRCLRSGGSDCDACAAACPFGAVDLAQEDRALELQVGAVILATGFDTFDPALAVHCGYGVLPDVRDALEFERMLSSTGPTGGRVLTASGDEPDTVALIHCVGSRTPQFNSYCSGVCCGYTLKFAHLIRKQLPDARVLDISAGMCLPGVGAERIHGELAQDERVEFLEMLRPGLVGVDGSDTGPVVTYVDEQNRMQKRECDLVVLATAMRGGADAAGLARITDIEAPDEASGFFRSVHAKLAPVSTTSDGVFIAGAARGPCDIETAVAQGQAAAGRVLSTLIPGVKLKLDPAVASVDADLCSGCGLCASVCAFGAIRRDAVAGHVVVDDTLCRGCGTCAAACPSGAVSASHYDDRQVFAEIRGVLR